MYVEYWAHTERYYGVQPLNGQWLSFVETEFFTWISHLNASAAIEPEFLCCITSLNRLLHLNYEGSGPWQVTGLTLLSYNVKHSTWTVTRDRFLCENRNDIRRTHVTTKTSNVTIRYIVRNGQTNFDWLKPSFIIFHREYQNSIMKYANEWIVNCQSIVRKCNKVHSHPCDLFVCHFAI